MNSTTIIQTPTNNLEESKSFYQKLNFQLISADNPTLFTDGKMIVEINPDRYARIGVKMHKESWASEIAQLEKLTNIVVLESGYLAGDPNGVKVYLINGSFEKNYKISGTSAAIPGNFAGLSIEAVDVARTTQFWKILGYQKTMGSLEQGWMAFDNDSPIGISIMKPLVCPHLFFNPGLTFFNGGKNLPIIQKIKDVEIPIVEEITYFNKEGIADNIIIRDPGGLGFFIFND